MGIEFCITGNGIYLNATGKEGDVLDWLGLGFQDILLMRMEFLNKLRGEMGSRLSLHEPASKKYNLQIANEIVNTVYSIGDCIDGFV